MKPLFFPFLICATIILLLLSVASAKPLPEETGGGTKCAICTIAIGLIEQMSQIHNQTVDKEIEQLCELFKPPIRQSCEATVEAYGPIVIKMLENKENGDKICNTIKFCTIPTCTLYPVKSKVSKHQKWTHYTPQIHAANAKMDAIDPWGWLKHIIDVLANKHEPVEDLDHDYYSRIPTLRGADWRGKDCNDVDNDIYPGRKASTGASTPGIDNNCNGIFGTDASGKSYEELFCSGDNTPMGVGVLGDSVGAHFQIPPKYLTAKDINKTTYDHLLYNVEDEFDVPYRSWVTGFRESTADIPSSSIYKKMLARNLCMHRDYQNLAVNGMASHAESTVDVESLARNTKTDNPMLVVFEIVGNDVCKHRLHDMTTPQQFMDYNIASLKYLDTKLPAGSHVLFIGLAQGEILWDTLHNRTHPVGVPYADVYHFLNCLSISPCTTWLTKNATERHLTTKRAEELTQTYQTIMDNQKFQNFDMGFLPFPIVEIMKAYKGPAWQLIEPVDGFHPSQIANSLMADLLFDQIDQKYPSFLPKVNPNNAQIIKIFGQQGGY